MSATPEGNVCIIMHYKHLHVYATSLSQIGSVIAPTGFALLSVNSTYVTLTWDELPCFYQNGPILGHVIEYTPDGGTTSIAELPLGSFLLTRLEPCTKYTLMFAARNDAGIGVFSSPLSVVTNGIGKA